MAGEPMSALLQHLRKVIETETTRQLSDGEALRRFAALGEDTAFATLMQRHGPLVMGVCRRFLRQEQDAEDAFQATFLVLARKAGSIVKEGSVASWLYGVAYRIAMKARRTAARRRHHESQAPAQTASPSPSDLAWQELQALLDEELNRLPEKYRKPFVLCCLESRSKKEAADELGWKEGTVSSRLAQARKLLQLRLARRGVELSAVLAGLAVAADRGVALSPNLAVATLQASLHFAAGGPQATARASAQAAAWAQAMLRALTLARLRLPAMLLLLLVLTGGGTAALLSRPPTPSRAAVPPDPAGDRRAEAIPAPGPDVGPAAPDGAQPGKDFMTVAGDVLLPGGGPAPGARVAVVTDNYRRAGEPILAVLTQTTVLGFGEADGQGRFRLQVPQTTAQHHNRPTVVTCAPGHALATVGLDRLENLHNVRPQLLPAQAVRGRLVGLAGEPAGGVRIRVIAMLDVHNRRPGLIFRTPPGPLPGWPDPVTTDADGGFVLAGLGPDLKVFLEVADERYATQRLALRTGPKERLDVVTLALAPARVLEGRVTEADSGRPLAGVQLVAEVNDLKSDTLPNGVEARTDADGRFRLRPFPGEYYNLRFYPPAGSPYLVAHKRLRWPAGAERQQLWLALQRGVLVQGRVIEAGSRRPVAGAAVDYAPGQSVRRALEPDPADRSLWWQTTDVSSGPDGSFALAVFPGQGRLLIRGPTADYLHLEISDDQLIRGRPCFADALVRLNLPPAASGHRVVAALRRGVTVRGRVLGQDGKPVASGILLSQTLVSQRPTGGYDPLPVREGRFELPGCDPERSVRVWFFDRKGMQGAVADLRGDPDAEPVVRLLPCRNGVVRIADAADRPLDTPQAKVELILRDGDPEAVAARNGTLARITAQPYALYGAGYDVHPVRDGRLVLPGLIPGARYALRDAVHPARFAPTLVTVPVGKGPIQVRNDTIDPQ
jgi:RNA polymerase sigma factor (sigma-70 family)